MLQVDSCVKTCLIAEAEHEHIDHVGVFPRPGVFSVGELHGVPEHGWGGDVPLAPQRLCQVALHAGVIS